VAERTLTAAERAQAWLALWWPGGIDSNTFESLITLIRGAEVAAEVAAVDKVLVDMLAYFDAHPDIDSGCFEVIDDEVERRRAALREKV
jgi:hypothetical protein